MATFIDLDSVWRDRELYPNPANYELTPDQVATWFSAPRNINALPKNPTLKPLDFVCTVNAMNLTIPYNDITASLPRIYVDFHSKFYNDRNMIYSPDNRHVSDKFIFTHDKVQSDINDNKIWIHFKCTMQQTMRFKRNDIVSFTISSRDGTVLTFPDNEPPEDPDPLMQTMCTFEIVPYGRDADYVDNLNDFQTQ
jgi:hypothetical protein